MKVRLKVACSDPNLLDVDNQMKRVGPWSFEREFFFDWIEGYYKEFYSIRDNGSMKAPCTNAMVYLSLLEHAPHHKGHSLHLLH